MALKINYQSLNFKLGPCETNLFDLLGEKTLKKLENKFQPLNFEVFSTSLRELVRYLFLCSYSQKPVFFPGDQLMDDLWHNLIIETADYRLLCEKIRPGTFLDHSGLRFDDYVADLGDDSVKEEQLSWLTSYFKNFGPVDDEAFLCLKLAQSLSNEMQFDLPGLNTLAKNLLYLAEESFSESEFTFDEFISSVSTVANEIDSNPILLAIYLKSLFQGLKKIKKPGPVLLTLGELEQLFGASTALAFVTWQHLAAVERLSGIPEWQSNHPELWQELASGNKLCGLATTHLAKPGGGTLIGSESTDGFNINGIAPWVCGYKLFDYLLIGFETEDKIVFSIVDFPSASMPIASNSISIYPNKMVCLNGSATVRIEFQNLNIYNNSIVSQRPKNVKIIPRPSQYILPEIGIGKSALKSTIAIVTDSKNPRSMIVSKAILDLQARLTKIEEQVSTKTQLEILIPLRDDFNRDAIRLLALALGSKAMGAGSLVARLQLEMILLDSIIQPPSAIESKILNAGRG